MKTTTIGNKRRAEVIMPETRSGTVGLATATPDANPETECHDRKVPKTIKEACQINAETRTDHWRQATDKELRAVQVVFEAVTHPQQECRCCILSQLLTMTNGLESAPKVVVVMITNRAFTIGPAFAAAHKEQDVTCGHCCGTMLDDVVQSRESSRVDKCCQVWSEGVESLSGQWRKITNRNEPLKLLEPTGKSQSKRNESRQTWSQPHCWWCRTLQKG